MFGLELAILLGFVSNENLDEITGQLLRINKMLTGLIRSLAKENGNSNQKKRSDKKRSRD